jgi:Holliday junction resolvase RusA-like endonuclease
MQYLGSRFTVTRHLGDYMSPATRRSYRLAIMMAFANQCPMTLYKAKQALEVTIEVRTPKLIRYPRLDLISGLYLQALGTIALENVAQIVRLDIKKVLSKQEEIVVTITPVV